eukprot:gene26006-32527_t
MLALQAGKHVLVEKAFCSTSAQASELLRFGKEKELLAGGVVDDAWEVHLYYDSDSAAAVDEHGLRHGGFRAILKGSLLSRDHAIRYMIHGSDASGPKPGTTPRGPHLLGGRRQGNFPPGEGQ